MNLLRTPLNHVDLFTGIAGFSLGLERTGGFKTVAFCEINSWRRDEIARKYPDTPIFEDIHDVSRKSLSAAGVGRVDVLSAGFPCQPFSAAGLKQGITDERFLWEELFRVIADTKPKYVVLENVPRLRNFNNGLVFAGILYDLAQIGYDAEWQILSAASFGAWHRRERLWIIAYPKSIRRERCYKRAISHRCIRTRKSRSKFVRVRSIVPNAHSKRLARGCERCRFGDETKEWNKSRVFPSVLPDFSTLAEKEDYVFEPPIQSDADGVPRWVVEPLVMKRHRPALESIGNAVVPQIPQIIGEWILKSRRLG